MPLGNIFPEYDPNTVAAILLARRVDSVLYDRGHWSKVYLHNELRETWRLLPPGARSEVPRYVNSALCQLRWAVTVAKEDNDTRRDHHETPGDKLKAEIIKPGEDPNEELPQLEIRIRNRILQNSPLLSQASRPSVTQSRRFTLFQLAHNPFDNAGPDGVPLRQLVLEDFWKGFQGHLRRFWMNLVFRMDARSERHCAGEGLSIARPISRDFSPISSTEIIKVVQTYSEMIALQKWLLAPLSTVHSDAVTALSTIVPPEAIETGTSSPGGEETQLKKGEWPEYWFPSDGTPDLDNPVGYVVRTAILDIVEISEMNRKECATLLLEYSALNLLGTFKPKPGSTVNVEPAEGRTDCPRCLPRPPGISEVNILHQSDHRDLQPFSIYGWSLFWQVGKASEILAGRRFWTRRMHVVSPNGSRFTRSTSRLTGRYFTFSPSNLPSLASRTEDLTPFSTTPVSPHPLASAQGFRENVRGKLTKTHEGILDALYDHFIPSASKSFYYRTVLSSPAPHALTSSTGFGLGLIFNFIIFFGEFTTTLSPDSTSKYKRVPTRRVYMSLPVWSIPRRGVAAEWIGPPVPVGFLCPADHHPASTPSPPSTEWRAQTDSFQDNRPSGDSHDCYALLKEATVDLRTNNGDLRLIIAFLERDASALRDALETERRKNATLREELETLNRQAKRLREKNEWLEEIRELQGDTDFTKSIHRGRLNPTGLEQQKVPLDKRECGPPESLNQVYLIACAQLSCLFSSADSLGKDLAFWHEWPAWPQTEVAQTQTLEPN
ncbi:hypothetical protein NMY22_g992 [Coprinellus aureogranulatus]|nr:hypothetical protein NMY22_g992 [Coprinellus aureogranulatus]